MSEATTYIKKAKEWKEAEDLKKKSRIPWHWYLLLVVAATIENVKTWLDSFKKKKTPDEIYYENTHSPKNKSQGPYTL